MKNDPFTSLASLFDQMDRSWNQVAAEYHFECNGCEDNCCRSLFFHHTYIEKAYLLKGFHTLHKHLKKIVIARAETYCDQTFFQGSNSKGMKIYCPLIEKERCLLYTYRPMICRLHGLPHELGTPELKPGCNAGMFDDKSYIKFDRTPFYRQMAQLEMNFRQGIHTPRKIKQTVAQMLLSE